MNDYKNKCSINIRDLILTFGDEHPQYDRQDWRSNGCPMDYWKWVSVQIRESSDISGRDDSSVPLKSETRIKQEKLFFFEMDSEGNGKQVVSGSRKDCLDARRKLMAFLGANCGAIQKLSAAQ